MLRCPIHELAAGPDGRCALCRTSLRVERGREGFRLGLGIITGSALLMVALLGYGAIRRAELAERRRVAATTAASVAVAASPERPPQPPKLGVAPDPSTDPQMPWQVPSPPRPLILNAPLASTEPAPPVLEATAAPTPTASAPAVAKPTPEQIRAALVATPIVMFTADWCSVCRRAHAFLRANGLSCLDRDIDRDPAALRELKERTGSASIPTLEIDGELERPGFSEQTVEHAVARSVERRLGVSDLAIRR